MKLTSKRLVSILLCLAFVLAMMPMAVMAADTVTVYYYNGASNWAAVNVYYWGSADTNPGWPGNAMTDMGNGYWSAEIPADLAGKEGVIFNNGNGSQTCNLTLPTDGKNCYAGAEWIEYTGGEVEIETAYYVAGDAGLCGSGWNPGDAANKMTLADDGKYYIEYANVAAGTYNLKVTDGTWNNSWGAEGNIAGSSNLTITAAEGDTVVVCFDPAGDGAATVSIKGSEPAPDPEPEVNYYVAGDAALCGAAWTADDANNIMTLESDGKYYKTYADVAAGTYNLKVTDGTWTNSWGVDGGNVTFTVVTPCAITVCFDAATYTVTVTGTGIGEASVPELLTVAGDAGICGSAWDPTDTNNAMTLGEDGRYYKTFTNVAAGEYGVKVTDGSWSNSWGVGVGNLTINVESTSTVTVYFTWETKLVEAVVTPDAVAPVNHDVKWQLTAGTTAESETTDLRLVSWVSSLDVTAVTFNVSINGAEPTALNCTAVYSAIKVDGLSVDNAAEVFGNDEAAYFVTYTIGNIPNADFGAEIVVSVSWTDAEGTTTSEARTIVVSDAL